MPTCLLVHTAVDKTLSRETNCAEGYVRCISDYPAAAESDFLAFNYAPRACYVGAVTRAGAYSRQDTRWVPVISTAGRKMAIEDKDKDEYYSVAGFISGMRFF